MSEHYCICCGKPFAELHHVIFRSQSKVLINAPVNHLYLCYEHHRGDNSPHKNRKVDLQYKKEVQRKLFQMFGDKEYYNKHEIKEKLQVGMNQVDVLTKTIRWHKEGYKSSDIVISAMGGRLYVER